MHLARNEKKTRMHSSRMRTARAFTVCWSLLPGGVPAWSGGVYLPGLGGVPGPGGVPAWSRGGVPAWSRGGAHVMLPGQVLPPFGQNDTRL